jgi:DNA polymerase I-like protein with 3'-5' exonuclease and polymerase domains
MSKLLLVDGNSLINRSFYAIRLLSNKKGVYTNAVTGFFNALLRLKSAVAPTHIAIAFDLRAPTLRHKKYDGYKKRRKGMPEELAVQMPYIKEISDAMGIARVELEGYEADDLIGTLSKLNAQVTIATGDKDSFQLINENVSVALATAKGDVIYTPEKIEEAFGITPAQFIEVKALMGDASDDIPGVAGIGEKTAFSLIQAHNSLDFIYENLDSLDISKGVKSKLENDREMAFLCRELAEIITDAPIDLSLDSYKINAGDPQKLAEILTELEIVSLLKKLDLEPAVTPSVGHDDPGVPTSIKKLENDLEAVLRDMEKIGVKIDTEGLKRFGEELTPQITEIASQIHEIAGEDFNIASPKQLSAIIFDKLGLPNPKKNSTNAEVLESLAEAHEIIPLILEYRALTKLNSTYVKGLLEHIKEDGRIHTTFKNETSTGRLSSADPNIQNIPVRTERGRILRRFFIADKGKLLVDADYSQIELRVLAHIANDKIMLEAFRNNMDIHSITAEQVFGAANRETRSAAKAVNFGIVYGMGAFSLAKEISVPVGMAKDYIEKYLSKYSGVRDYLERVVADAKATGYVRTLLGRVRHIPEIQSSNKMIVAAGERIAKNTPIQGTAADIIKIAMIRVHNRLKNAKLILQVHDELIAETPEAFADETAQILQEEMIAAGKELDIDLTVDVGTGKSWYEC